MALRSEIPIWDLSLLSLVWFSRWRQLAMAYESYLYNPLSVGLSLFQLGV